MGGSSSEGEERRQRVQNDDKRSSSRDEHRLQRSSTDHCDHDDDRRHKKRKKKSRDRKRRDYDRSDESSERGESDKKRRKYCKKKSKARHRSSDRDRSDSISRDDRRHSSSDNDSYDRSRKGSKKKRRDDDSSTSSDDSSYRRRRRDRKKSKKRHKHKKKEEHRKKQEDELPPPVGATFGKYGIVKASDFYKKQRSFEIWMAEVKGIQSFNGPKWELQNYFAEYCEDFNTATFPHMKYYDYDDWEMKEYRKQEARDQEKQGHNTVLADEARHQAEMRQKAKAKLDAQTQLLRATMNAEKIQDMKHQAQLQSEMAHAFKRGDDETVKRIQKKLEPESR